MKTNLASSARQTLRSDQPVRDSDHKTYEVRTSI